MDEGICKGCGAPVYWVRGLTSGKPNIVERKRLAVITDQGELVYGYEPHWAYCPKAELFKRKKEGSSGK